ncbi:MAG: leucine-rich repeat domain-containing protein [Treponema sp.]|jgi:hypothetical protein|nr:leucine-rich repeat domain-containing protein [Treponema sp.]
MTKKLTFTLIFMAVLAVHVLAQDASSFMITVTRDGSGAIVTGYGGSARDVIVPANIQGLPVKEIGVKAFRTSKITSVVIPEGVTIIGDAAFQNSEFLHSVTLPDGIKTIGREAFHGCSALTAITLPNSITEIGVTAFANTALKSITWPTGVSVISDYIFRECSALETVNLPEGVITIGQGAFYRCSALVNITVPATVKNIGNLSFNGCVSIPLGARVPIQRAGYRGSF